MGVSRGRRSWSCFSFSVEDLGALCSGEPWGHGPSGSSSEPGGFPAQPGSSRALRPVPFSGLAPFSLPNVVNSFLLTSVQACRGGRGGVRPHLRSHERISNLSSSRTPGQTERLAGTQARGDLSRAFASFEHQRLGRSQTVGALPQSVRVPIFCRRA